MALQRHHQHQQRMTLDLSGIHSDSTTTSQSPGGGDDPSRQSVAAAATTEAAMNRLRLRFMRHSPPPGIDYDRVIERKNVGHRVVWSTTAPYHDDVILGNGKVRALTKYFDFLHDTTGYSPTKSNNHSRHRLSQSHPNLQHIDTITQSSTTTSTPKKGKLSEAERVDVMLQLREWSKFGTQTPPPKYTCTLHCRVDKCSASVINLMAEEYGKCPHMDEIFNRIDNVPPPNRFKSVPNIATYHPGQCPSRTHKKFPDAYIVMKKRPTACCTGGSIGKGMTGRPIRIQSCPDLPGAPQPPTFMTLRQIKNRQASKAQKHANGAYGVDGRHNIPRFYSR
uniref:Uncharacterized protein n=1 Tax=Lutzomyia longipalpis TaxID=7200 RepID=A0A1B0FUW9_LUTLO